MALPLTAEQTREYNNVVTTPPDQPLGDIINQLYAGGGGAGYTTIQEDGISLTQRSTLDFVGDSFTASDTGSKTQVVANNFTATTRGVVPASGGGTTNFLRADGSWAAVAVSAYTTIQEDGISLAQRSTLDFVGDSFTASDTGSKTQIVANNFTATTRGVVPASGGGTTNFLRADGTWAAPSTSITVGTTVFATGTLGSVLFIGAASVVQQDNANLFWDNTNKRFALGTTTPTEPFHLLKTQNSATRLLVENASTGTAGQTDAAFQNSANQTIVGITSTGYTTAGTGLVANNSFLTATSGAAALTVQTNGTSPLIFGTNSTESARINATQQFGIGTTTFVNTDVVLQTQKSVNGDVYGLLAKNANTGAGARIHNRVVNGAGDVGDLFLDSAAASVSNYAGPSNVTLFAGTGNLGLVTQGAKPIEFWTNGGTLRAHVGTTEFVVNDAANDYDFRVEGFATRPNLFLVDAGTARVGINRAAGTHGATLDVDNLAVAESIFIARNNGTAVFTIAAGGGITLGDAINIAVGSTTGTKIGTSTTQKIGFFNAAPVVQQAAVPDATGGAVIDVEARAAINAVITNLEALGLQATV